LDEAFQAEKGLLLDGSECPPAGDLWYSAHGELSKEANESVILHTMRCPACAEGWRLARNDVHGSRAGGGDPEERRILLRWNWRPWIGAAAVMILALGIGYRFFPREEPPAAIYRDPGGLRLQSLSPQAEPVPRSACLLRWTAGPPGTTYDVQVTTDALEPLLEKFRLEKSELRIDPELLADLPTGTELFWRVTAHPPNAGQVRSPAFRTQLR